MESQTLENGKPVQDQNKRDNFVKGSKKKEKSAPVPKRNGREYYVSLLENNPNARVIVPDTSETFMGFNVLLKANAAIDKARRLVGTKVSISDFQDALVKHYEALVMLSNSTGHFCELTNIRYRHPKELKSAAQANDLSVQFGNVTGPQEKEGQGK